MRHVYLSLSAGIGHHVPEHGSWNLTLSLLLSLLLVVVFVGVLIGLMGLSVSNVNSSWSPAMVDESSPAYLVLALLA